MQERNVSRIEIALVSLAVVRILQPLAGEALFRIGLHAPFVLRQPRLLLRRAHVDPYQAAPLRRRDKPAPDSGLKSDSAGSFGMSTHCPVTSNFQPW